MAEHKGSTAKTVAKGAASVAAAAGVVAGVAAMADKDTRNSIFKGAQQVLKTATSNEVVNAVGEQYQTAAHQIRLSNKSGNKNRKNKTANKKTDNNNS